MPQNPSLPGWGCLARDGYTQKNARPFQCGKLMITPGSWILCSQTYPDFDLLIGGFSMFPYPGCKEVPAGSLGISHQIQMNIDNVDDVSGWFQPLGWSLLKC